MIRAAQMILLALLLAGCLPAAGPGKATAQGPNPITGAGIEVTSLDAPSRQPPARSAAATPAPTPAVDPEPESPPPRAGAEAGPATTEAAAPAPKPAAQVACEKTGGQWARAGKSAARTCIRPTRDAGKSCSRGSQCEGECLARSGSCAPITPLFGCNDILQDDGRAVTLCID